MLATQPHCVLTEQLALACMMEDNRFASEGVSTLSADHFHLSGHRAVFEAIGRLVESPEDVGLVSVHHELEKAKKHQEAPIEYLSQIAQMYSGAVSLKDCMKTLENKMLARSVVNTANHHIEMATNEEVIDILEQVRSDYDEIRKKACGKETNPLSFFLSKSVASIRERHTNNKKGLTVRGVPTGFKCFDQKLGGLSPSNLIIGAARPGMGKTALIINMLENIGIVDQTPVGFFSLEMSHLEIMERMFSSQARIPLASIRSGELSERELKIIEQTAQKIENSPIFIDDSGTHTMASLATKCYQLKTLHNVKAIFIDYLQLIDSPKGKQESPYEKTSQISRKLKCLAKDLDIPIVCLSQLSRSVEQRTDKTPFLSDLRDSGSIEQDADSVFFIFRKGYYDPYDPKSKLIIAKNRHGAQGEVEVKFENAFCTFQEIKQEEDIWNINSKIKKNSQKLSRV
jgi:replicative DNA helicase